MIYQEPNRPPAAITGDVSDEGEFLIVRNARGSMTISKKIVLVIKNAGEAER